MHRSDDSGTTENFTDYLEQGQQRRLDLRPRRHLADQGWRGRRGHLRRGRRGEGGDGTIGYADESQAGDLGVVSVKVGEEFIAPSAEGAAKVVAVSPAVEGRADVDMAVDIDRTTTESGAYPLLLASYLIACQTYDDAAEADLVKGFLSYIVSDEGQQAAAEQAGSAPLDSEPAGSRPPSIVGTISAS